MSDFFFYDKGKNKYTYAPSPHPGAPNKKDANLTNDINFNDINFNYNSMYFSIIWKEKYLERFSGNLYSKSEERTVPDTVDLSFDNIIDYFVEQGYDYRMFSGDEAYVYNDEFFGQINFIPRGTSLDFAKKYRYTFYGERKNVNEVSDAANAYFKGFKPLDFLYSDWAYISHDNSLEYATLQLASNEKFIPEMYPYIEDVDKFIDDFAASKSNVLIMTGDPGLGKSSLIKYMIDRMKWKSVIAYDDNVMYRDTFYMNFITGNENVMILEDADQLLGSRLEDSNKIMSKILNVSDGILSSSGKKFIFTANIENKNDIDKALSRPGRCFAITHFRPLTPEEAEVAAAKVGRVLVPGRKSYTVAEIFTGEVDNKLGQLAKLGFT